VNDLNTRGFAQYVALKPVACTSIPLDLDRIVAECRNERAAGGRCLRFKASESD
jgi:hypothetical protein